MSVKSPLSTYQGIQLTVEGQGGHDKDIATYVESKFKVPHSKQMDDIRAEILSQASGVFLWEMSEAAERRGTQKILDIKAKASASVACAHSSFAWMKRKGKGLCELCLKGCAKYSFQCLDCGTVACGGCKTKFCLT